MSTVSKFAQGGYRFVSGVFQYSAGVSAEPGFQIVRARFAKLVAIDEGFEQIEKYLTRSGRPIHALCACELRSPHPFDDAGFLAFNKSYVEPLRRWGIVKDDVNPIARSNVCPAVNPPLEPRFYAFSYTVPVTAPVAPTFVVAGSGEAPEGRRTYGEKAVRIGEHSPDAIREKAQWVLREMERRMAALHHGRRNRPPRGRRRRTDVAVLSSADRCARLRNGCPRRTHGNRAVLNAFSQTCRGNV